MKQGNLKNKSEVIDVTPEAISKQKKNAVKTKDIVQKSSADEKRVTAKDFFSETAKARTVHIEHLVANEDRPKHIEEILCTKAKDKIRKIGRNILRSMKEQHQRNMSIIRKK